jgi:hypothetical protein
LFYVYPLKFLFTLGINDMIFGGSDTGARISQRDLATLFSIYSFGFAGIYLAFTLLYLHAWRLRDALDLSRIERLETRYIVYRVLAVAIAGLIAGLARTPWFSILAWADLSFAYPDLARITLRASATPGNAARGGSLDHCRQALRLPKDKRGASLRTVAAVSDRRRLQMPRTSFITTAKC